jgi:Uma2 family endonuclease
MIEVGIFTEDDRVELINGEIITMSPIGPLHSGKVIRISNVIMAKLLGKAIVSVQNPSTISNFSELEPDITILKISDDFYESNHPTPTDIFHIIEVANSSLEYDQNVKLPLYAKAGIPSYLIVDVNKKIIEVYSNPEDEMYKNKRIATIKDQIELVGLSINVKELLG